jgi:polygalacturonase
MSFVSKVKKISKPTFPNNTCNIIDYGAEENNIPKNTSAFKKAITACASMGGGVVIVPNGLWTTGSIHLKDNINLHLAEGATIFFSGNPDDYLPVIKTRFIGLELYNYSPMIYAKDCKNIAITGKGIIDGNGQSKKWKPFIKNQKKAIKKLYSMTLTNTPVSKRIFGTTAHSLRPSLIQPYNCNNVWINGVTIKEGPMWTIHAVYTNNLIISDTTIRTTSPNTDGIVIDSSTNVLIQNNDLSTGDDAISIKSGRDKDAWRVNRPSENIILQNNEIIDAHAGISFGSEMSGSIKNVLVENLTVLEADRAVRIKTTLGRGGYIKNILVKNSSFHTSSLKESIQIDMDYGSSTLPPKTKRKPSIQNIKFNNLKIIANSKNVIAITGIPNKLSSILFNNVSIENTPAIVNLFNVKNINFINTSALIYEMKNSAHITIQNRTCPRIHNQHSKKITTICQ